MKQFITILLCIWSAGIIPLRAQQEEAIINDCERRIRKLQNAPDDERYTDELYQLALYCQENGNYEKAGLLASLVTRIYAPQIKELGNQLIPSLIQSFTFKEEDMNKHAALTKASNTALYKYAKAMTLAGEAMTHFDELHQYVEETYQAALSQYKIFRGKDDVMYARTCILLGDFYAEKGEYAKAEKAYRKAISIDKDQSSNNELDRKKNKLVLMLIVQQKFKEAEKLLDEMRKADDPSHPFPGFEDILCSRACMAVMKKDYTTAETLWKDACGRYQKLMVPTDFYRRSTLPNFLSCFSLLAGCYASQGKMDMCLLIYNKMKECIVRKFGPYIPYYIDLDRKNLLQLLRPLNEAMQYFAMACIDRPGMPEFMYSNEQLMKQFFLKSPSVYDGKLASMQNDKYLLELRQRQEKVMLTEDAMSPRPGSNYLPLVLSDMRSTALSREAVNYVRKTVNEEYHCNIEWKSLKESLDDTGVMIEFALLQRPADGVWQYVALVFSKADASPHFVPLCEERTLRVALNTPAERNGFILKSIWNPLKPYFGNKTNLSIFPTGLLNTFAFGGITDENGQYLCQKYELGYYLSALDHTQKHRASTPDGKSVVLFGGADYGLPPSRLKNPVRGQGFQYLPSSKREVMAISETLKGRGCNVQVFSGREATEKVFRNLSLREESPFILHISTHGFYLPYDSRTSNKGLNQEGKSGYYDPLLRTGLALSGASTAWKDSASLNLPDDGLLTAYEIFGVGLMNTELVVLSACNTGLGEVHDGDGVYGLQRAFRSAGARSLIVSLAEVPDKETAEFMSLFYQNWKGNASKHSAFLKAQREMMGKYPDSPEKWANFILIE